jgi:hypothetical protein
MYHIVLIALIFALSLGIWNLVHAAPMSVAYFLPRRLTFYVGAFLFLFGIFFAFLSAYPLQNAPGMIGCFVQAYIGLWLLLAHHRGDEQTIRQVFLMVGTLLLTIVAIYYVQDPRGIALLSLIMVASGYWLTVKYLRFLDGPR